MSKNDKRDAGGLVIVCVVLIGVGFWVIMNLYSAGKSNVGQAREASSPQWTTVNRIAVVAVCGEEHARFQSTYAGEVEWMTEAGSAQQQSTALLQQDAREADKWLARDLDDLAKPWAGKLYRPPSIVALFSDDHSLPSMGKSSDDGRPGYRVACSSVRPTKP